VFVELHHLGNVCEAVGQKLHLLWERSRKEGSEDTEAQA
jgi:hypothetical protein